jgi:hypothetical protein
LRGGTTKQSGYYQSFPDCFTSLSMTKSANSLIFNQLPPTWATCATSATSPRRRVRVLHWGCFESRILSSLRGRSPKQSSNYQPFLDCFTAFAMTGLGF